MQADSAGFATNRAKPRFMGSSLGRTSCFDDELSTERS